MNTTAAISSITGLNSPSTDADATTPSEANATDPAIERALSLLQAGGLTFVEVERCSAECVFCDSPARQAA